MNTNHLSPTPSPDPDDYQRPSYAYAVYVINMNIDEIQVYVLLSMLLQCFLFSCASERRRTNKTWLVTLISLAYFLADWVAPYTIGLMSVRLKLEKDCHLDDLPSCKPLALISLVTSWHYTFWAPFLLLHLGGPDNVTSLSAEENNMWLQQLVRLISQTVSTILIFVRFSPFAYLTVSLASYLVFLAGLIRYMERVHSLYLARSGGFKESRATRLELHAGPDYQKLSKTQLQKLSETQRAMREANIPTQVERVQLPPKKFKPRSPSLWNVELEFDTPDGPLDEKSLLQFALCFYNNFKGLFFEGSDSYSHEQRQFTRNFFLNRSSSDAFKLAEIELSFIHKDLHTKSGTPHLDGNPILRILTTLLIGAAAFLFYTTSSLEVVYRILRDYRSTAVKDQMVIFIGLYRRLLINVRITYVLVFGALILEVISLLMVLLSSRNVIAFNYYGCVKPIADAMVKRRKWSESFSKCNFIGYYLCHRNRRRANSIAEFLFIGPSSEAWKLKRTATLDPVSESFKDKIFTELKKISKVAQTIETATKICSQRGGWTLIQRSCYRQLKWSLEEVEYGHSFLLWHIATDLVCHNPNGFDKDVSLNTNMQLCKDISEYLFYLHLAKPTMIAPAIGNSVKFFQDTCLEAKRLIQKRSLSNHDEACREILSVYTKTEPVILKGHASESLLFDACRLAEQLLKFEEDKRWTLMSGVWMELLTYVAFHSKGTDHAHQPSQGGELLTFVWLLMNHLGLGKQFEEKHVRTGYRVVIRKIRSDG